MRMRDRRDTKDVAKGRALSVDELRRLYRASDVQHWHDLFLILLGTGCRPGAARELRKEQIDFAAGLIDLNQPGREQTNKRRPVVRLPDTLRERFQGRADGVLVLWRGEVTTKNERLMRAARKRAGLDKAVNLYSLRSTCSQWLIMQGVSLHETAFQLGHKVAGYDVTYRYVKHSPDYLVNACAALEKLCQLVVCDTVARQADAERPAA